MTNLPTTSEKDERIAFDLLQTIMRSEENAKWTKEEILSTYKECIGLVGNSWRIVKNLESEYDK